MNLITAEDSRKEIILTIADLRDLLNASSLMDEHLKKEEINHLIQHIERKNNLPPGSLSFM